MAFHNRHTDDPPRPTDAISTSVEQQSAHCKTANAAPTNVRQTRINTCRPQTKRSPSVHAYRKRATEMSKRPTLLSLRSCFLTAHAGSPAKPRGKQHKREDQVPVSFFHDRPRRGNATPKIQRGQVCGGRCHCQHLPSGQIMDLCQQNPPPAVAPDRLTTTRRRPWELVFWDLHPIAAKKTDDRSGETIVSQFD